MTKTLRVLCLHGFRTNVQVMQDQTRALQKTLGPNTEFVFLDGPFEAEGEAFPDIEEYYKDARPFFEWLQFNAGDSTESLIMTPEATKRLRERIGDDGDEWFLRFAGVETALTYLDAKIRELGPFDVALGFSQGGLMLTVLSMWCLHQYNRRFWKLTVCVSTCRVNGTNCKYLFVTPDGKEILIPYPSVHVIGKEDPVRRESLKLIGMYDSFPSGAPTGKIVLEHTEGHRFPSFKKHKELYEKLADVMNQYRSENGEQANQAIDSRL